MKRTELDFPIADLTQRHIGSQKRSCPGRSLLKTRRSSHEHVGPTELVLGSEENPRLFLLESDLQRSAIPVLEPNNRRNPSRESVLAAGDVDEVPLEPATSGGGCGRRLLSSRRKCDHDKSDDEQRDPVSHDSTSLLDVNELSDTLIISYNRSHCQIKKLSVGTITRILTEYIFYIMLILL